MSNHTDADNQELALYEKLRPMSDPELPDPKDVLRGSMMITRGHGSKARVSVEVIDRDTNGEVVTDGFRIVTHVAVALVDAELVKP